MAQTILWIEVLITEGGDKRKYKKRWLNSQQKLYENENSSSKI